MLVVMSDKRRDFLLSSGLPMSQLISHDIKDKPPYTISPYQQAFYYRARTHIITLERLQFADVFFLQIIPVDLLVCCWIGYFIVPKFLLSNWINKKSSLKIKSEK